MTRLYNSGKWTVGRFNSFVTSILRSGSRRWEPKYACKNAAKTEIKTNVKTGRKAQHYMCASCGFDFPDKEVEIDHILPVASGRDVTTWDQFIDNLFCEPDNLQCLCKACHQVKTQAEKPKKDKKNASKERS